MSGTTRLNIASNQELIPADCIVQGNPQQHRTTQFTDEKNNESGSWYCSTGQMLYEDYPCNELCVMIEGKLSIKDMKTGVEETYIAGDAFICQKGSDLQWTVQEDMRKFYMSLG